MMIEMTMEEEEFERLLSDSQLSSGLGDPEETALHGVRLPPPRARAEILQLCVFSRSGPQNAGLF